MVHHSTSFSQIAIATLLKFSTAVVLARDNELVDHAQQFHDLAFLRLVLSTWQDSSVDTTLVDEAILRSRSYVWVYLDRTSSCTDVTCSSTIRGNY